jgi:hypothetical protein
MVAIDVHLDAKWSFPAVLTTAFIDDGEDRHDVKSIPLVSLFLVAVDKRT